MFGSMFSKFYKAHIALWPMTSIIKQGSSLSSSPIFPSLNTQYTLPFGSFDLVSGGRQRQITILASRISSVPCSTMWLGCQSRRFNCLFWRETRQRILGHEISPYPEVGRGRERGSWRGTRTSGVDDVTQQRAVGGWTAERRTAEGWRGRTDRGSQHQTPEQRGEAAWDRVQREWVKMSLIPVGLWNFR